MAAISSSLIIGWASTFLPLAGRTRKQAPKAFIMKISATSRINTRLNPISDTQSISDHPQFITVSIVIFSVC